MRVAPHTAGAWCAWARKEYQDGRIERALEGFRRALAIDPASFPARSGLISVLLDMGNFANAGVLAEAMAADAGDRPEVLWLNARVAHAGGEAERAHNLLARLLADPAFKGAHRAEALLLNGLVLGDLSHPAKGFTAACEGKWLQRDLSASDANAREGEVVKLRRLTTWLATREAPWPPLALPAIPHAAASHVFLLGFPRSGTTLLEQVLAAHPHVETLEEAPTLAVAYQAFLSDADALADLSRLDAAEAEAWAEHYWSGIRDRGLNVAGRVFVDKQPAGTLNLPVIARLFPRAKILFALRDPRDVVLSCFRQSFQMNAMTYAFTDLAETAACYDACMALAEQARPCLPLAWLDVRHEALVDDFEGELGRILAFLELEPHAGMVDFARAAATRPIRTPSAPQVRAGLNRRGLGRWTQYRDELAVVLPTLVPWVERFGYSL